MIKDPSMRMLDTLSINYLNAVNPPVNDSATFAFPDGPTMSACFEGKIDNAFLYARHWNPTSYALSKSLAAMENTESAWVTGSGMAAITSTILQVCSAGDHIISSIASYGGSYAFMKNYLPKFNIEVSFANITNLDSVKKLIRPNTKMIYTESMTNPLLQIADIPALSEICKANDMMLVVDNTFTPLIVSPSELGADVVVHSMTKFINGKNDCVAGAICSSSEFIGSLADVNSGTAMLLGPVLDSYRASNIHKNLFTLHVRIQKHSQNGMALAKYFQESGQMIIYPGLKDHPQHELLSTVMNPGYGYGGMLAIDMKTKERANTLMVGMQKRNIGYLAVSLGYFKTLFSNSGTSTSSEIPLEEQKNMGLSEGLIRFSVGLDQDISQTWSLIEESLKEL